MPNITIHEEVGFYLSSKLNISSYEYYLGILAPDAVNLNGFAEKEVRWLSHQRRKDILEWKKSLNNFYEQEKNNYPKDFIFGYYIHILTDIIYDEILYSKVTDKILKDGNKDKNSHEIMLKDMSKYSFPKIEEIKNILESTNNSYSILNIDKKLLLDWKNKTISNFPKINESKYITNDIINILNEKVLKEIKM